MQYNLQVKQFAEQHHMPYITSLERMGIQQGIQQGEYVLLLRQLQHKFQQVPDLYLKKLEAADSDMLLSWGERVLGAKTLSDVFEASASNAVEAARTHSRRRE